MMKQKSFMVLLAFALFSNALFSQIISGPMLGYVELRTAKIWVEVKPGTTAYLWYAKKDAWNNATMLSLSSSPKEWYTPLTFHLVDLDVNTSYEYALAAQPKKPLVAQASFATSDLWQWRKPAPDFSFLTGSCAYFNEPMFDRPGRPYGNDSPIFSTMAKEQSAFMLWLGDNWYLREADYFSEWGIWYRAHHDRALPVLQDLLKAMPHYAIWDDHDYGPNDGDKSFIFKSTSRDVFNKYWANPSSGFDNEGIYTKVSYSDCDFFLMDDRTFRSNDDMQPTVYGQPNPGKRMWGSKQMEWLKTALTHSKAPFKFIVTGSQTLNPASPFDCLQDYPIEFQELMQFLSGQQIQGVLFLTGDRHHSEVIRYDRMQDYPLYDITSSPLTSGVGKVFGKEKENPARMPGTLVETQNYTRITVAGPLNDRTLNVAFVSPTGETLGTWKINEKELKNKP